jgi:hypothetical protein
VGPLPERLLEALAEASALGLTLDLRPANPSMQALMDRALDAVDAEPAPARVADAVRLVQDAVALGLRFGLWRAQNRFFDVWQAHPAARAALVPLGDALGFRLVPEPA